MSRSTSRRSIVVEDITFHWKTNGYGIAIHPPKGFGGPRMYSAERELNREYTRDGDWSPVTPRLVAELIYRDILKKPMPEPKPVVRKQAPERKAPKPPSWTTCPDLPRTYLVQARLAEGGTTLPLEVHETPVTAREAAARLNHQDVAGLVTQSWKWPGTDLGVMHSSRRKRDEADAVRRIVDWMRGFREAGMEHVPAFVVETVELPFKMPR